MLDLSYFCINILQLNCLLILQEMKRTIHKRTSLPEHVNRDSNSNEISYIPRKSVRYSLRNRNIFDDDYKSVNFSEPSIPQHHHKYETLKSKPIKKMLAKKCSIAPQIGIQNLPNEMLITIFSYLTAKDLCKSAAPVCKHWYDVANSPSLWKKLSVVGDNISTEHAKYLLTKSPLLQEMFISYRY